MKKLILLLTLSCSPLLHGLYFGNPDEPDVIEDGFFIYKDCWFGAKLGYQGDLVFDRKLRASNSARGRMDEFRILMNQGVATFSFFDRLEFYGSVGSMKGYITHRPQTDMKRREYESHDHLTWGGGARAVLIHWGCAAIGANANYQQAKLPLKWNALNGESFNTGASAHYREWQAGLGVSYQVDIFFPYIGGTYSQVHAKIDDIRPDMEMKRDSFKMHSRQHFGLALGCSLSSGKNFGLNAEVRMFDEEAITVSGDIKF